MTLWETYPLKMSNSVTFPKDEGEPCFTTIDPDGTILDATTYGCVNCIPYETTLEKLKQQKTLLNKKMQETTGKKGEFGFLVVIGKNAWKKGWPLLETKKKFFACLVLFSHRIYNTWRKK